MEQSYVARLNETPDEVTLGRSRVWSVVSWGVKIVYAVTAAAFCAAIASYAPTGGPPIAAFVPTQSALLIHAPSGAAIHRAIRDNAAFKELLDDPDIAAIVAPDSKASVTTPTPEAAASDTNEPPNSPAPTLSAQVDALFAKLPWPVSWLITPNENGLYPLIGGECAVALVPMDDPKTGKPIASKSPPALIFMRVSGSTGHLARLAAAFVDPGKKFKLFDLGGGLLAIGLNGAVPELYPHKLPAVVTGMNASKTDAEDLAVPMLRLAYHARESVPTKKEVSIDLNNEVLVRLFEENVPESVLRSLQKPPGVGEMLNFNPQSSLVRIDFFAKNDGTFCGRGQIDGGVPPLPLSTTANLARIASARKIRRDDPFADFRPNRPKAEFMLPIDLRACFLHYIESSMRLAKNTSTLTKEQGQWASRFRLLADDRIDLDATFWPFMGHVAVIEISDNTPELGLPPYLSKAWLPCDASSPETLLAAAELARLRWLFIYDNGDRITVKGQYVKRFHLEKEDRYVLSTGQPYAPVWSIGPKGLRFRHDAGLFALLNGPKDSDFLEPFDALDAYRVRIDGPRLAAGAEYHALDYFESVNAKSGAQTAMAAEESQNRIVRLATKGANFIGKFVLEIAPNASTSMAGTKTGGAEVRLDWQPGRLTASPSASEQTAPEKQEPVPSKTPKSEPRDVKKDPKKTDDDDAPPPPPGN